MRLIFIRHGDPDYSIDNLTPKGKREVALLTKRILTWKDITQFYTSPMGRAKATGAPALEQLHRTAIELPWLREFTYECINPQTGKPCHAWDFTPDFYVSDHRFFEKEHWTEPPIMQSGDIYGHYKEVCEGFDAVLASYGYHYNAKGFYDIDAAVQVPNHNYDSPNCNKIEKYHLVSQKNLDESCTLVFFCHLGVMFTMIAHMIGVSAPQLWQGFYVAPTSITILNSEERKAGQAFFRVERLGDTNHLTNGGEPISSSGYFADVLQETR